MSVSFPYYPHWRDAEEALKGFAQGPDTQVEVHELDPITVSDNNPWEAVAIVGIVVAGFVAAIWRFTR